MIKPVMTMKKPNPDFTFASAATARNMKKLASRRILAIRKSPHYNQVNDDEDDYNNDYRD
jgi:hypothetical protein